MQSFLWADQEEKVIEAKRYLNAVLGTNLVNDVLLSADSLGAVVRDGDDITFTV